MKNKINKKLLVNLGCLLTGGCFGWCITDIYHTRKSLEITKANISAMKLSAKNLEAMVSLYDQMKQKYTDYKNKVNSVISEEELDKMARDKYFTE